jgi:hypothetical protein
MPDTAQPSESIVLGWQVTNGLDPRYWLGAKPMPGQQAADDLVLADPASIAYHTVIVAQSGSGKSYFLGRVLEEIALKTKSRVVIFDPNADFRKIHEIVDKDYWDKKAGYKLETRMGFLPNEPSKESFESRWNTITKTVLTMDPKGNRNFNPLRISWPAISIDFLSDESDSALKRELSLCHEVVGTLGQLIALAKDEEWRKNNDLLSAARGFFEMTRDRTEAEVRLRLQADYPTPSEPTAQSGTTIKFSILHGCCPFRGA